MFFTMWFHALPVMLPAFVLSALFLIVAACYRKSQKIALISITLFSTLVLFLVSSILNYDFGPLLNTGCELGLMVGYAIATYLTGLRFSRPIQVLSAVPIVAVCWVLAASFLGDFVNDEFVEVCLRRQEKAHE